jgi:hypothetical protein
VVNTTLTDQNNQNNQNNQQNIVLPSELRTEYKLSKVNPDDLDAFVHSSQSTTTEGLIEGLVNRAPEPREIFNNVAKFTKEHGAEFLVTAGISMGIKAGLSALVGVHLDPFASALITGGTSYLITATKQTYHIANANLIAKEENGFYQRSKKQTIISLRQSGKSEQEINEMMAVQDKAHIANNIGLQKGEGWNKLWMPIKKITQSAALRKELNITTKTGLMNVAKGFFSKKAFASGLFSGVSAGVIGWASDQEPVKAVIENAKDAIGNFFQEKMGWLGQMFGKANHDLPTDIPTDITPATVPDAPEVVSAPVVDTSFTLTTDMKSSLHHLSEMATNSAAKDVFLDAMNGDAQALKDAGHILHNGLHGVGKDLTEAYKLFSLAENMGDNSGALDRIYSDFHGLGTHANPTGAIEDMKELLAHPKGLAATEITRAKELLDGWTNGAAHHDISHHVSHHTAPHHAAHHTTTHHAAVPHHTAAVHPVSVAYHEAAPISNLQTAFAEPQMMDVTNTSAMDVSNDVQTAPVLSEDSNYGNRILGEIAETKKVEITHIPETDRFDIKISPIDPNNPADQAIIEKAKRIVHHTIEIEDAPKEWTKPTLTETMNNVVQIQPHVPPADNVIYANFTPKTEPLAPAM